jgi:hypothetical protein
VDIRRAKRKLQNRLVLVVLESKVAEAALLDAFSDSVQQVAATDAQEDNIGVAFQTLGSSENGVEFMRWAKVSGIANDELILEPPFATKCLARSGLLERANPVGQRLRDRYPATN